MSSRLIWTARVSCNFQQTHASINYPKNEIHSRKKVAELNHFGSRVRFGSVIDGTNVLEAMQKAGDDKTGEPVYRVEISKCGQLR